MKVLICGTEQTVPDNYEIKKNQNWVKPVDRDLVQGDVVYFNDGIKKHFHILSLVMDSNGKFYFQLVSLNDGCRWVWHLEIPAVRFLNTSMHTIKLSEINKYARVDDLYHNEKWKYHGHISSFNLEHKEKF